MPREKRTERFLVRVGPTLAQHIRELADEDRRPPAEWLAVEIERLVEARLAERATSSSKD